MDEREAFIYKKIKQTGARLTGLNMKRFGLLGLTAGTFAGGLIMFLSLFVPFYGAIRFALLAMVAGPVTGVFAAYLLRPDMKRAALLLDSKGFKERVITSYERFGDDSIYAELVKEDCRKRLEGFSVRKAFSWRVPGKQLLLLLFASLLLLVSTLLDTPAKQLARDRHAVMLAAEAKADELKETLQRLEQNPQLTKQQKQALKEAIETAQKEMLSAKDKEDVEKAAERLEKKVAKLAKEELEELAKTSEELSDALKEAIEKGADTLTEEELAELSKKLSEAADKLSSEELAELGKQLADGSGTVTKQDLENALASLDKAASDRRTAMLDMEGTVGMMANGTEGGAGSGNTGGSGDEAGGNGSNGSNGNNGTGQAGGNPSGGGWFNGSDKAPENNQNFEGDMVSVPDNMQDNENLTGETGDGESYLQEGGPSLTWDGQRIDFRQVFRDYQQRAYEKIEGGAYPQDVRDYIRYYFEYLNQ